MKKPQTTNPDKERAERLGDTGHGDTGVPEGEQGISNRAGDTGDDADEVDDDFDELEEEDEEDSDGR
jgi:hypothetical protein